MTYKEQIKTNELITKIRIIRYVRKEHLPIGQVATAFSCHRNTIGNIINAFEEKITPEDQASLVANGTNLTQEILLAQYGRLLNTSRKPQSNKRQADKTAEDKIRDLFTEKKIRVGAKRMRTFLKRRYENSTDADEKELLKLTAGQLKGIYKRHQFRVQKIRVMANDEHCMIIEHWHVLSDYIMT